MKILRSWLHGRSVRWVTQQLARAVFTAVLAVASTAESARAFQWLSLCAMGCAVVDSMCLWTGSCAKGQRLRAGAHQAVEAQEAAAGIKLSTKFIRGDFAYDRGRYEGFGNAQLWLFLLLVVCGPLAIMHKPSTLATFGTMVCSGLVSQFGPFTVPSRRGAQ